MEAQNHPESKSTRQKFTAEEDARLIELVRIHGNKAWKKIASIMKTRTTRQCRERYINYLSPSVTNGPWSAQEDSLLIEKVQEMGPKWSKIAKFFPSRSDVNIKNRYALFVSKGRAPALQTLPREKHVTPEAKVPEQIPQQFVTPVSGTDSPVSNSSEMSMDELLDSLCNEEEDQAQVSFSGSDPEAIDWNDNFDFSIF
ncbi:Myb-like DNA-binding domain containing protein [Trichomonas vaginalis G3]|uniref:Myb-like DNA-binding domain containing protein n=1 Tax=Trichomonas vaginalis (strain ATCC PRA-98 / G3) TaxID=412133 RepID=A2DCX2_TRIV3|nr:RNA polymerase II transcription regulator recruiting protein [Trichomonas vaginalis G3]EAY21746.1 Myb-like DNA-binding domain containing protein [Trichomonas vaginalis G3]KAI5524279.1 RNA polymerase II transcription regulator recruiting protein [Trichomonas vaginalis G3]|eukprot:XP_001582732.1 Myb-like DNA-binding domain containing protein [Trichomonas vaginalis G3]